MSRRTGFAWFTSDVYGNGHNARDKLVIRHTTPDGYFVIPTANILGLQGPTRADGDERLNLKGGGVQYWSQSDVDLHHYHTIGLKP